MQLNILMLHDRVQYKVVGNVRDSAVKWFNDRFSSREQNTKYHENSKYVMQN